MADVNNKDALNKAISSAVTLASAGKLNPEQSDRFIDYVFDETVLKEIARTIRFRNEEAWIEKIGIGRRAAVPAAEGVDPGIRRGVNQSRVVLKPVEVMVPTEITSTYLEHNVEGESAEEHILRMFARQLANDWELLCIHGNTGGILVFQDEILDNGNTTEVVVDTYLALFNGWLKQAENGNVVDAEGGTLSASIFRKALKAMPTKYKKDKSNLVWVVPTSLEEAWRERMSARATNLGDQSMQTQNRLTPFGIMMVPVPLMSDEPQEVETDQFSGAGATITLANAPIVNGSVLIILDSEANKNPTTPYEEGTDFSVNYETGVITHIGAGAIPTTTDLRITYKTLPSMILTDKRNLIAAIGRDITIEKDRDIFKRVNQFAITAKFDAKFENDENVVLVRNISDEA